MESSEVEGNKLHLFPFSDVRLVERVAPIYSDLLNDHGVSARYLRPTTLVRPLSLSVRPPRPRRSPFSLPTEVTSSTGGWLGRTRARHSFSQGLRGSGQHGPGGRRRGHLQFGDADIGRKPRPRWRRKLPSGNGKSRAAREQRVAGKYGREWERRVRTNLRRRESGLRQRRQNRSKLHTPDGGRRLCSRRCRCTGAS